MTTSIEVIYLRVDGIDAINNILTTHVDTTAAHRDTGTMANRGHLISHDAGNEIFRRLNQITAALHNEATTHGDTDALRAAIATAYACATIVAHHTKDSTPLTELKGL